ncbi:MAG: beta-lactamase family protein [Deltaproteobacteria bacterium]|nr:beta-lactamase family protein [Deltaproteobacteria bacterium]
MGTRLLVMVLALLAACGGGSGDGSPGGGDAAGGPDAAADTAPDGAADAGADAAGDAAPEVQSLDPLEPVLAQSLQALLEEYLAFSGDPGMTLTVRTGAGEWWSGAAGLADLATGEPMEPGMGFRVGSNTKTFTSTLVLMLADEGLVDLDASLADYLPEYPQWEEVTVRMLLSMRSGLHDYLTDLDFIIQGLMDPSALTDPLVLVDFVADLPFDAPPGTTGAYCNTNYVLLGLLVERLTGQPFQEVLQARIVEPLGLAATRLDETPEEDPGLAHGYMDLGIVALAFGIPPEALTFIPEEWFLEGQIVDATYAFPPMSSWSAGSMISSSEDMVLFMRALLRGELLSAEALAEMQEVQDILLLGGQVPYGLGLQYAETSWGPSWGHGGLNFGYQASTRHLPDADLTWSAMHDYLPEQSWILEQRMLTWLMEGRQEVYEPCLPPGGFFPGQDGTVELRLAGPLNPAKAQAPVSGIARVQARLDGELLPVYGLASWASLTTGFQPRVTVETVGPSTTPGVDMRYALLSVNPALLEGAEGLVELSAAGPFDVITVVAELVWNGAWGHAERSCVVAVTDTGRDAALQVCGDEGAGVTLEEGAVLKVFASLPVTTDPAAVDAALALLGAERCTCQDQAGEVIPCP